MTTFAFEAIGTKWIIEIHDDIPNEKAKAIEKEIHERIAIFDKYYSRFRKDSLVAEMSKKAGGYVLPEDAKAMLDLYVELYAITDGAFSPLIGDTLIQAGYDATYSLIPKDVKMPLIWGDALFYDFPNLTIKKPTMLDFGGLGKGYLIDIIASLLGRHAIPSYTIDAGGDMTTKNKTLVVGLENPENHEQVIGTIELTNGALCGSSGSRRAWANYHHIIDARTHESPRHILATWATAPSTLIADAMATCLFFVDGTTLKHTFNFDYLVLYSDYRVEQSEGFKATLFSA